MLTDFLKTVPQYVLPKNGLTTLSGCLADVRVPSIKNFLIRRFITKYSVNMQEALESCPENYATFNDFFIRELKPGVRPLADASIISPVDGAVSELGRINHGQLIQAKGRHYSVSELLACSPELCQSFEHGQFATLYLAPKDYHRVHMPVAGTLREMHYVPGKLFSVQPTTARVVPKLFARNERVVCIFDTPIGAMAMVMVGATIVGGIATAWHGDVKRQRKALSFTYTSAPPTLAKASEMGYFKLGSTVVVLFANDHVTWREDLAAGSAVRFGEALAHI